MRIMGKELEDILVGKQHIVILTHMAPDGDAMGSALALYHWIQICQSEGRSVRETVCAPSALRSVSVIVPNAFPAFYSWMPGAEQIKIYEKEPDACSALIAAAGWAVVKISLIHLDAGALASVFQWKAIVLAVVIWLLTNVVQQTKKWHPLAFIALSAVAGVLFRF